MSREDAHFRLRISSELLGEVRVAASANNRSINGEIVARLSTGFQTPTKSLSAGDLAEALDAFWNATISEARNRQSTVAMDCAAVMAVGLAAVAEHLRGAS